MAFVQSIPGLWLQLAIAAAIILFASNFLAKSADIIAIRTGLGRTFIGVILLATATSLPELGTGIGSVALVGNPDLAAGDAFGSNIFNLLIIGVLDIFWRNSNRPILNSVSTTSMFVGVLGIMVISVTILAIVIHAHPAASSLSGWSISPITVILALLFIVAMYLIYRVATYVERFQGSEEKYSSDSLARASITYLVAAVVIIGSAFWLAYTGEAIAHAMHWEASFVGTQFLAFSTSLPELAASFAALRINAPELAVTNLLGSNLFNMGFILVMDDLAFVGKPIWSSISPIHEATALLAIFMTSVVIIGLMLRNRTRPLKFLTYESLTLIALYIIGSAYVFQFAT